MNAPTEPTAPTTQPSTKPKFYSSLSKAEQIERLSVAWCTHAPEAKFADKNWAEFRSATEMSRYYRSKLASIKSNIRGMISDRAHADRATRAQLKRIASAVKIDPSYGPDSALYRAMGFIPDYERKRPSAPRLPTATAAPQAHTPARPSLMARLATMRSAWAEQARNSDLGGSTLAQFDEAVAPSHTTREGLEAADIASMALVRQVIRSITAATGYGSDCALYRALGFIPDSERRSPRRSAPATTPTTPAAPAQQ